MPMAGTTSASAASAAGRRRTGSTTRASQSAAQSAPTIGRIYACTSAEAPSNAAQAPARRTPCPGVTHSHSPASSRNCPPSAKCPPRRPSSMGCITNSPARARRASGSAVARPISRQASTACSAPQAWIHKPQYCPTSTTGRSALKAKASSGMASA